MREILFRGQIRKKGEKVTIGGEPVAGKWIYGGIFAPNIQCDRCIITSYDYLQKYPVYADTVGQYTCMTDKNGTKIFENDIISAHLDDLFPENETRLVVVWHDYGFFGINPRYIDYTQYQVDLITMITSQQSEMKDVLLDSLENEFVKKFEVIGNIYDNPELLKTC